MFALCVPPNGRPQTQSKKLEKELWPTWVNSVIVWGPVQVGQRMACLKYRVRRANACPRDVPVPEDDAAARRGGHGEAGASSALVRRRLLLTGPPACHDYRSSRGLSRARPRRRRTCRRRRGPRLRPARSALALPVVRHRGEFAAAGAVAVRFSWNLGLDGPRLPSNARARAARRTRRRGPRAARAAGPGATRGSRGAGLARCSGPASHSSTKARRRPQSARASATSDASSGASAAADPRRSRAISRRALERPELALRAADYFQR